MTRDIYSTEVGREDIAGLQVALRIIDHWLRRMRELQFTDEVNLLTELRRNITHAIDVAYDGGTEPD